MLAADDQAAAAVERPEQRAGRAVEEDVVERHRVRRSRRPSASACRPRPASRSTVSASGSKPKADFGAAACRLASTPSVSSRPGETHLLRLPLAAHQRRQRELDVERAGAHRRRRPAPIATSCKVSRGDGSRRPSIAPPTCTSTPTSAARLGLEQRAVVAPVDQQRPDQRRHQRQDDRDRNAEQGRLQCILRRRARARPRTRPSLSEIYAISAGCWRQIYVGYRTARRRRRSAGRRRQLRARRSCPGS